MQNKKIIENIYQEILDLKKELLDMKKQINDLTAWQLRSFIPPDTPSIPIIRCNNCDGSCKFKKDLDF